MFPNLKTNKTKGHIWLFGNEYNGFEHLFIPFLIKQIRKFAYSYRIKRIENCNSFPIEVLL